jgi:hypothetical protein
MASNHTIHQFRFARSHLIYIAVLLPILLVVKDLLQAFNMASEIKNVLLLGVSS